jgi:hypothetical protein
MTRWILRVVAVISILLPGFLINGPIAYASNLAQSDAPGKTINLQLIVDSSGSMGAATNTGELRIDAAKRVLTQVISEIPAVDGVNVGFRVYGHLGDNTDAGRPESCLSSELKVPMEGINSEALIQQVNALQPVGWTPLGYSLEQAALDFKEPASENVVNAVVMVTDGLETCDADPAAIAGQIRNSEAGIITHVIGFGTTPEEQAILSGIAEAGGGQLLGAANASELTSALFNVLEELEIVQGVGFIGGNAIGLLPPGEPGVLSVVAVGPFDGNVLPIIVRNNTGQDVIRIKATASALNPAGQQVAVGGDQLFNPNLVRSGGLSIGYAYFGGADIPADSTFKIDLESTPATDDQFENIRDLEVVEATVVDGRIVGTLTNIYDATLTGPVGVVGACFDENGSLLAHVRGFANDESIDPSENVQFQIDNYSGYGCPLFLVAGSGWDNSFGRNNTVEPPSWGTPEASSPTSPTTIPNVSPGSTPSVARTATCPDLSSPESIIQAMQAAGLPVGVYEVYTAETDPNGLMGRPLQYIAKANFRDTRIQPMFQEIDFADGGSLEIFATPEDAQARYDYVMGVIRETPSLSHYLYLEGTVLLRISGTLTPDEAAVYGDALTSFAACGE